METSSELPIPRPYARAPDGPLGGVTVRTAQPVLVSKTASSNGSRAKIGRHRPVMYCAA